MAIVRAGIDAADGGRLVRRALADDEIRAAIPRGATADVLAVGKAARPMLAAFAASTGVRIRHALAVGPSSDVVHQQPTFPAGVEWHGAGHPVPDDSSATAARRALELAARVGEEELFVVLLSGGASSLMALPAGDLPLSVKQETVRMLLAGGADITALNTVRKHISAIKGGRLAAACRGTTLTLAVSDVVGDDLSVIGSGPTVADPSTWRMALDVLEQFGGSGAYPPLVVDLLQRGAAGALPDTPKAGDPGLARSLARVIGGRTSALEGAQQAAVSAGYHVHIVRAPVVGEARQAARGHLAAVGRLAARLSRPLCVLSAGETTVHVTGKGSGGRNQEFALALARPLRILGARIAAASVGTDGIDGPTDAAGAIVDNTTMSRAAAAALDLPDRYLDDNNTYNFFRPLDDLIRIGPTNTNVGDLQVVLIAD